MPLASFCSRMKRCVSSDSRSSSWRQGSSILTPRRSSVTPPFDGGAGYFQPALPGRVGTQLPFGLSNSSGWCLPLRWSSTGIREWSRDEMGAPVDEFIVKLHGVGVGEVQVEARRGITTLLPSCDHTGSTRLAFLYSLRIPFLPATAPTPRRAASGEPQGTKKFWRLFRPGPHGGGTLARGQKQALEQESDKLIAAPVHVSTSEAEPAPVSHERQKRVPALPEAPSQGFLIGAGTIAPLAAALRAPGARLRGGSLRCRTLRSLYVRLLYLFFSSLSNSGQETRLESKIGT